MALENQRYGRNKATLVNKTYIESGEYRAKFDRLTENPEMSRLLYAKAKEILFHRSGTLLEDMYWLDAETGEIAASALNEQSEEEVTYTADIMRRIKNRNLITIHNHPASMPPSIEDFNSAVAHNYSLGITVCHDGTVYAYRSDQRVPNMIYVICINRFIGLGYSEKEAQLKTLEKLSKSYAIDFWEV